MITRNRILFILGLWIVFVPLSGFPSSYESFFIIVSGIGVTTLAFLYARDKRISVHHHQGQNSPNELSHDVYTENYPKFPAHGHEHTDEHDGSYTNIEDIRSRSKTTRTS